jgi:type I restriction enzyme M protein
MADEQTKAPWKRPSPVPQGFDWPSHTARDGASLERHYRELRLLAVRESGFAAFI